MTTLDEFAEDWTNSENQFFKNQLDSDDIFKLILTGNKRTGSQIQEWNPPISKEIEDAFKNWDGKSQIDFAFPEGGEVRKYEILFSENKVPESVPELGQMELYKSSKVTDFISGSFLEQYGLIVSQKVKNTLQKFDLGNHNFYPLELVHKGIIHNNYWFFRSSPQIEEYIDYKKSKFYTQIGHFGFNTMTPINIDSKEELLETRQKLKGQKTFIRISELYTNDNYPQVDLVKSIQFGVSGTFISKRLKNALTDFTGIEIQKTKRIKITPPNTELN